MFCCNPFKGRRQPEDWSDTWRVKVTVVGDGGSGKTCLIQRYCSGTLPPTYTPTLFDTCTASALVDGRKVQMVMQDTAGQEDLGRLRPPLYLHTDVVIVCFSVDMPDSWDNVRKLWVPEARRYCGKHVPILLVANKTDLAITPPGSKSHDSLSLTHNHDVHFIDRLPTPIETPHRENPGFHDSYSSSTVDNATNKLQTSTRDNRGFRDSYSSITEDNIRDKLQTSVRDSGRFGSTEHLVKCVRREEKRSLLGHKLAKADRLSLGFSDKKTQGGRQYGSTVQEGHSLASQVGAVGFFQTSAVLKQGTEQVFQAALSAAITSKQWRKKYRL